MSKRVSLEEAEKRVFEKHDGKIIFLKYVGSVGYSLFRCNVCQSEWEATADSVWRGNGCLKCYQNSISEKFRTPYSEIKSYIEDNGCNLISPSYINGKSKIEIEFECGHIGKISFESFRTGSRCNICSKDKFKNTIEQKTRTKIIDFSDKIGFEIISFQDDFASWDSDLTYKCNLGHIETRRVREFMSNGNCRVCTQIKVSESQTGSKSNSWKGGRIILRKSISHKITQWKKDSMENCDYKCVITGKRFDDIHHLYSFNKIIDDALLELGLDRYEFVGEYSDEELLPIFNKVVEIHYRHPLGVCLTKNTHKLFHNIYGSGNNTPEQFYEFIDRIKSGEIEIN